MAETISLDLSRKVDHQQHSHNVADSFDSILVIFQVGYMQRPSADFVTAMESIQSALARLDKEVRMIRHWGGDVTIKPMRETPINPVINEAMAEGFRAAAAQAYPEMKVGMSGRTTVGDLAGYFVRMNPKI